MKPLRYLILLMLLGVACYADTPEPPLADAPKTYQIQNQPKVQRLELAGCECGKVPVSAVQKADDKKPEVKKHARGYKLAPEHIRKARKRASIQKYGHIVKSWKKATQSAYDAWSAPGGNCVPPIGDQDGCGDCYMWSGCKVCSAAQMTAGVVKPGSAFMLSVQQMLDCHPDLGGCGGGDEYQVAQTIQSGGCASFAQYPGTGYDDGKRCQSTANMTLYTVNQLVYVGTDFEGEASIQDIKNAILANGYVSVAVAAGDDWDNISANGTITGNGTGINHAVGCTGWDDNHDNGDGSTGALICDNQWGLTWAGITINTKFFGGRTWMKYNKNGIGAADSFGTNAFVAIVTPVTPPTPVPPGPTPVPPGPTPVPPTPGTITITLTADQVQSVLSQAGVPPTPPASAKLWASPCNDGTAIYRSDKQIGWYRFSDKTYWTRDGDKFEKVNVVKRK